MKKHQTQALLWSFWAMVFTFSGSWMLSHWYNKDAHWEVLMIPICFLLLGLIYQVGVALYIGTFSEALEGSEAPVDGSDEAVQSQDKAKKDS